MGRLDNKVAFISGIAGGQGRSHAIRLAQEGADILGFDIADQIPTVPYPMGTKSGLEQVAKEVEALGRRCIVGTVDVRDEDALSDFVKGGIAEFGHIDVVIANAGICSQTGPAHELTRTQWDDVIDVNLTGVWLTTEVAVPHMVERGSGGSIFLTAFTVWLTAKANLGN